VNEGLPDETVVCKQIVIAPKPQPALTGTVQVCLDSTGNVYTTQSGMTNYQWSLTGGIITGGGTTSDNTVTVTWNMAGLQQIRVNYSNSFGCSADSATVLHVTVHDLPVPSISGPSSVCLNSPGLLYATQPGMTNYSWQVSSGGMITSGGTSTDNTITITWTQTGMQSVSVNFKDTNGCTAASPLTFDITVHPLPVPALTGPVSVCRNSQGNMYKTQAGMTLYAWSVSPGGVITAGGSSADSTVTVTWTVAAAEYVSVNYTDSNGCTAVSPVVLPVLVNPLPVPSITGPTDVCINSPGNVYSTEPGMVNYIWSVYGSGTITGGGSTGDNTISITWTSPGPEIVSVSYTDTNHCSSLSPSNLSVWVKPLPDTAGMITGTNRVCAGSQGLLFTVMPVPNADYYVWSIPAGATIVSGQNTDSVIVDFSASALPGDFLVYGVNGCGNGFSSPAFHIAVKHPATVSAGPDTIACAGTIITVRHSSASDYTGLNWTTGGQGTLLNDTTLNPTYLPSSSDTGDVILSVRAYSDPPCPDDTSVMVIHYSQGPVVSTGPDMLTCIPFPVSITGASASHCSSVTWTTTGQGQISGVNSLNPVYTPVPADSGIVSLTLHGFGSAACPFIIVSDETRIMVYTALRTRSHKADTVAYEGIDTLFIPVAGGSGNYRYSWSPGASLLNDSVAKPVTTNLTYGLLFTLTVEDRLTGCTATDTLRVHVKAPLSDENCLVVHNVLTPNGDGINDKWIIDCIEQYEGNKVEIFNRWGSRVRIYTNYDNALQAWDGTDESDKPLPDGVYYYVITVPAQQVLTGWVLLRASSK
jgi:gliding motility-associated-like protein